MRRAARRSEARETAVDLYGAATRPTLMQPIVGEIAMNHEEPSSHVCEQTDPVTQEVNHEEPAAQVDEQDDAIQVEVAWTSQIEHRLAAESSVESSVPQGVILVEHDWRVGQEAAESPMESIYLLEYNRYPASFRDALLKGAALEPCRSALAKAGLPFKLTSGAKIFVHPWQHADAMGAIFEHQVDLRPYHVIVCQSLEYHVDACLADLSCRQGARVRKRHSLVEASAVAPEVFSASASSIDAEHDGGCSTEGEEDASSSVDALDVKRTFICASRRLRNPESVTQSTTEVCSGGLNPRRVMEACASEV